MNEYKTFFESKEKENIIHCWVQIESILCLQPDKKSLGGEIRMDSLFILESTWNTNSVSQMRMTALGRCLHYFQGSLKCLNACMLVYFFSAFFSFLNLCVW